MIEDSIGFQDDPKNGFQITRSRTTGNLRAWEIPRTLEALDVLFEELGNIPYPGLYILFEDDSVYIGEASNIVKRIKNHMQNPSGNVEKVRRWEKALIINDGRPATQSDINDIVVRRALENYLRDLFRDNNFDVVSQAYEQELTAIQKHYVESYIKDINVLLIKKGAIDNLLDDITIRKVYPDDLERKLIDKGYEIQSLGANEATIDNEKYYIRTGSEKPKGFQITFRARTFKALKDGENNLLVDRDGILIIPISVIRAHLGDQEFEDKVTIDIFVRFDKDKTVIVYHEYEFDVSDYILDPMEPSGGISELDSNITLYDVSLNPHQDQEVLGNDQPGE